MSHHDDVIEWKHFLRYWPFVRGIHRWRVNSMHKGPVTRKMFPSDDIFMFSQITSDSTVYSNICWSKHQRKHQSPCYRPFVMGIHRWPVDSPHKGPVTRKAFPLHDVTMAVANKLLRQLPRCSQITYCSLPYIKPPQARNQTHRDLFIVIYCQIHLLGYRQITTLRIQCVVQIRAKLRSRLTKNRLWVQEPRAFLVFGHQWPVDSPDKGPMTYRLTAVNSALSIIYYVTVMSHERHGISNYRKFHILFDKLSRITTTKIKYSHYWPLLWGIVYMAQRHFNIFKQFNWTTT